MTLGPIAQLGLTTPNWGPRYVVTYRFVGDYLIRQDLYPYAKGGPVTNTPPGQELIVGFTMTITVGWYQSSHEFFHYLKDQRLPADQPRGGGQ